MYGVSDNRGLEPEAFTITALWTNGSPLSLVKAKLSVYKLKTFKLDTKGRVTSELIGNKFN